jgi:primosomal protein N'
MKIAIVHDNLVCKGGAEQVALSFHNAFPEAPVYTLSYDSAKHLSGV